MKRLKLKSLLFATATTLLLSCGSSEDIAKLEAAIQAEIDKYSVGVNGADLDVDGFIDTEEEQELMDDLAKELIEVSGDQTEPLDDGFVLQTKT